MKISSESAILLLREIMTISRSITYIRNVQFSELGIGKGQHAILTRIHENPGINQESLSEMLRVDKTTIAKSVKRLEELGFIRREIKEDDNRERLLYLTDKFNDMYNEFELVLRKITHSAVEGLSESEVEKVMPILKKISTNVQEEWQAAKVNGVAKKAVNKLT